MGKVFAGRYELVDQLAVGGSGTVWRTWDRRDQAYRAGKVLNQADSGSLVRFIRETGWRIEHPHVMTPLGWAGEDDQVLLTMPLIRGGSLAMLMRDYGPLPQDWALVVADQLLDALGAVHDAGMVHRDVKPGNVLLALEDPGEPDIRLSDFGIAVAVDEPRLTRLGDASGTMGYQAPDAAEGADPEPAHDLHSAGVVMVEMLTGRRPLVDGSVPGLAEVAADIRPAVEWLIATPSHRATSAAQARERFAAISAAPHDGEPVVVLDQIPPLPPGWGPHGKQVASRRLAGRPAAPPSRPEGPDARQTHSPTSTPGSPPTSAATGGPPSRAVLTRPPSPAATRPPAPGPATAASGPSRITSSPPPPPGAPPRQPPASARRAWRIGAGTAVSLGALLVVVALLM
ncbi:MAG: serine/threonine-protein kinase [Arachnia sp.]